MTPEQCAGISASSALADDPRQVVLDTLKFVECRLRCAALKGVAVVETGGVYTARDCPSDVVRQLTAREAQGANVIDNCTLGRRLNIHFISPIL